MNDGTFPETITFTYPIPEHGWTCFHCGETFKTKATAREHFGFDISSDPACRIKLGAEQGLVGAIRDAEKAAADAWHALHEESSDIAKAYSAQATRHHTELRTVEELGYERGLADARREAESDLTALRARISAMQEAGAALCNRTLVYVGATDGTFDPDMECDAEMRSLAETALPLFTDPLDTTHAQPDAAIPPLQSVIDLRAEAEGLEAEYGPNIYSQFLRRNGRRPDPQTAAAIGHLLGARVRADDGSMYPETTAALKE